MMAADGEGEKEKFFDFKCGMLDGSGEKTMGELCKGKKAILVVNVASEWGVTERDYTQLVQMDKDLKDKGL
jgi:glutathione peroxidase-family protein